MLERQFVTPTEQIALIAEEYPELERRTNASQTSFWMPELGSRGRVVRIKHGDGDLKLAATALRFPTHLHHFPKFAGPASVLRQHVDAELHVLEKEILGGSQGAGHMPNWQIAVNALGRLGGAGTRRRILEEIRNERPDFDSENLRKDLVKLSVNDDSRFAYRAAETKRTGSRADLDRVFRGLGSGDQTIYELYDPAKHGLWIAYLDESTVTPTKKGKMRLRRQDASISELVPALANSQPPFDPASATEGKNYVARQIAARQGQAKFRKGLLDAYGGRCCLSGCSIREIVEAAHIYPYAGKSTNDLTNGLPLRADLHTLFDLGLIRIQALSVLTWEVHPSLKTDPEYAKYDGQVLKPISINPSAKSIEEHRKSHASKW